MNIFEHRQFQAENFQLYPGEVYNTPKLGQGNFKKLF